MNDIPAIKKVYEVLHKFLFTGKDQLKKSPTKTNKRPNEKSLIILSLISLFETSIEPATSPKTPVIIEGIVVSIPSGSHVSCHITPGKNLLSI